MDPVKCGDWKELAVHHDLYLRPCKHSPFFLNIHMFLMQTIPVRQVGWHCIWSELASDKECWNWAHLIQKLKSPLLGTQNYQRFPLKVWSRSQYSFPCSALSGTAFCLLGLFSFTFSHFSSDIKKRNWYASWIVELCLWFDKLRVALALPLQLTRH